MFCQWAKSVNSCEITYAQTVLFLSFLINCIYFYFRLSQVYFLCNFLYLVEYRVSHSPYPRIFSHSNFFSNLFSIEYFFVSLSFLCLVFHRFPFRTFSLTMFALLIDFPFFFSLSPAGPVTFLSGDQFNKNLVRVAGPNRCQLP